MMRSLFSALVACSLAGPAVAQQVTSAPGAVLRALDKTSGQAADVEIATGQTQSLGRLRITLHDCRFPTGNPSGNAYAALEIDEIERAGPLFYGWMVASAPGLNALEHRRYDVWVLRCTTS